MPSINEKQDPEKTAAKMADRPAIAQLNGGLFVRVRMINTAIRPHMAGTPRPDDLALAGVAQLGALQAMVRTGNRPGARSAATRLAATLAALAGMYRKALKSDDITPEVSAGIHSTLRTLDRVSQSIIPASTGTGRRDITGVTASRTCPRGRSRPEHLPISGTTTYEEVPAAM
jgi:hypothetical protein